MSKKTVMVPKISCNHCTRAIEQELNELEGVESVKADPGTKQVEIAWSDPASWEQIASLLLEIGYPADPS